MEEEKFPFTAVAQIEEYIEPIDRGDRYEDPLGKALEEKGFGAVTGGGTQLDDEHLVLWADVDMELANLDDALDFAKETLNNLGVPIGSKIHYEKDGETHSDDIGKLEVLGIYLDGIGLPEEVYAELDFAAFYDELKAILKPQVELRGIRQANEETGLFAVGASCDKAYDLLPALTGKMPILQNARITFRRLDQSKIPKELRLPRNRK